MKTLLVILQFGSAFFYAVSAGLWFYSAKGIIIPKKYQLPSAFPTVVKLDPIYLALKRQARWNAFAAFSAFVATAMQASSLVLAYCLSFD